MREAVLLLLVTLALGCKPRVPPGMPVAQPRAALSPHVAKIPPKAAPEPEVEALTPEAARHVLNRFTFGPKPGDSERLIALGFETWFEQQLKGKPRQNPDLEAALEPYRSALGPPRELLESWLGEGLFEAPRLSGQLNQRIQPFFKDHLARLSLSRVTRHVLSERQLEEVMLDFWSNHFNVFARKGLVRVLAGDYIERALRPNALGNFQDVLLATARHPAMLVYLDNAQSRLEKPHDDDPLAQRKGLNENYARELLELHTLGVQAGYSQTDVTEVARALTGWSVERKGPGALAFAFRKRNHDAAPKSILGVEFPGGGGEEEGVRLLALLAAHPSTARHLATKLCARFVTDSPTPGCVARAEHAYLESRADIPSVLRAIGNSPDFWADSARGSKLKTPLEFLVGALRALDARPDGTTDLARELGRLGEPLLEESVPTGYPDSESDWSSSAGLLARMNLANSFGFGKPSGVRIDLAKLLPETSAEAELEAANRRLLGGFASAETLDAVRAALADPSSPDERRSLTIALLLGSPDFQRR